MIDLAPEDLLKLAQTLTRAPLMQEAAARRQAMILAGLGPQSGMVNLEGAPQVVAMSVLSHLAAYGHVQEKAEALGHFLNALIDSGQFGEEDARFVSQVIAKYQMMVPLAWAPTVDAWQGPSLGPAELERVFGENTLRKISFLEAGMLAARSVFQIEVASPEASWLGTGFLVAPGLGITNHHVIPSKDLLQHATLRFNFQDDAAGNPRAPKLYRADANGPFGSSPDLDYTVFAVEGSPEVEFGYLPLIGAAEPRVGDRVNVIQHPNGGTKMVSIQNNKVEYVGAGVVQYLTATNPGSSGSPLLNDEWRVIGVHHAGGSLVEPSSGRVYSRNEGILVGAILRDLDESIYHIVEL